MPVGGGAQTGVNTPLWSKGSTRCVLTQTNPYARCRSTQRVERMEQQRRREQQVVRPEPTGLLSVESHHQLQRNPADGQHPHPGVEIGRAEFDQLGPPQPGLDQASISSTFRCRRSTSVAWLVRGANAVDLNQTCPSRFLIVLTLEATWQA